MNYSAFFYKDYRIFSVIFFENFFDNNSINFLRKSRFHYERENCFFQFSLLHEKKNEFLPMKIRQNRYYVKKEKRFF